MSFDSLKKNRKSLDTLKDQFDSFKKKNTFNSDADEYWKPTRDAAGNGSAIIRFLMCDPSADNDPHVVRYWEHGFKGPTGQWYIEKSLTTLNQPDPVGELNQSLWNSGDEDSKKRASAQKRKLTYVANILVIKDPNRPENEGKVFKFRFGQKIMDKIQNLTAGDEDTPEDELVNPFDLWEGVNFRMRIKTVSNFPNYDDSEFDRRQTAIADNDEEIERIWKLRYNLAEIIAPESFKSYDDLKARLDVVLGNTKVGATGGSGKGRFAFDDDDEDDKPSAPEPKSKFDLGSKFDEDDEDERPVSKSKRPSVDDEDEDEDMSFFKNLAGK